METAQRILAVVVALVLFAPLAYTTNFLFAELARRWGTLKFLSALAVFTFASFVFYVWLFLRFRTVGLVLIYLILVALTLFGLSFFREEFREAVRNTRNGFRKTK